MAVSSVFLQSSHLFTLLSRIAARLEWLVSLLSFNPAIIPPALPHSSALGMAGFFVLMQSSHFFTLLSRIAACSEWLVSLFLCNPAIFPPSLPHSSALGMAGFSVFLYFSHDLPALFHLTPQFSLRTGERSCIIIMMRIMKAIKTPRGLPRGKGSSIDTMINPAQMPALQHAGQHQREQDAGHQYRSRADHDACADPVAAVLRGAVRGGGGDQAGLAQRDDDRLVQQHGDGGV